MYKVLVNESYNFELSPQTYAEWDIAPLDDRMFHIIHNQQVYIAELVEADFAQKTMTVRINNTTYKLQIQDHFDQLINKLGFTSKASNKVNQLKAPMPGLVRNILVTPRQAVQKGDNLLILEAMKMENILKSPGDGIIKHISVASGDPVNKGQTLIEFE
jgi:biotin carboxyl carrier protein